MKKLLVGVLSMVFAAGVFAGEIYAGLGTTGATVGYGHTFNSNFGVRGELNYFKYSKSYTGEMASYDADLNLSAAGVYADYYPFANGFRVSVGAHIGSRSASLTDKNPDGVFTINGTEYVLPGESLQASIDLPTVVPFVGVGYSSTVASSGFGWFMDAGVAYLKPEAKLTASAGLAAAAGAEAIAREERNLQDKLDKLNLYPVLRAGISYRF